MAFSIPLRLRLGPTSPLQSQFHPGFPDRPYAPTIDLTLSRGLTPCRAKFLTGVVLQRPDHWLSVYDFGRVYSPLLVCLAAHGLRSRTPVWFLAPWLLMLPRLGMQLAPQILKIAVWLGQPLTHAN